MNQQDDNYGRDQFIIGRANNVAIHNLDEPDRNDFERGLLKKVEGEVASRLNQSLHNKVLIVLDKQEQPEQVKRLWNPEVKIGSKPAEPLLPKTSILEVFERAEIAGRLLILGAPGAGKTTTMLDLAQPLIKKARQDIDYPIPVVFNLSSWKGLHQSIPTWLVEELKSKYRVRKDIGKKLIEEKRLLPMLDGLDEVNLDHQEPCMNSINQWLQGDDRPLFIVVCSRQEEYANHRTRLHLNGAIALKELMDQQIQEYLADVKRVELWQILQQDKALLKLVKTPLLLSMTVLSYEELSQEEWQDLTSTEQRIKMLLGAYVKRMLHREVESKAYRKLIPPSSSQTKNWLVLLARQLQRESQTEFLIEKIQPSWLVTSRQKEYRWLATLIPSLISGLLVGLPLGLSSGLLYGLLYGLVGGLVMGLVSSEIDIKTRPNQGIHKSAINALFNALTFGLIIVLVGLGGALVVWVLDGFPLVNGFALVGILIKNLFGGLITGAIFALYTPAGKSVIQHLALRFTLYQSGSIPWNYAHFLNYCTERCLLQRVGGRYQFIHKQLQDHFAESELTQ